MPVMMNVALLGKLGWQIMKDEPRLWVQVLRQKYILKQRARARHASSHTWKSIASTLPMLKEETRWIVANGEKIRFWTDKRLTDRPLINRMEHPPSDSNLMRMVVSYWQEDIGRRWPELITLTDEARIQLSEVDLGKNLDGVDSLRWNF